MYRRFEMLCDSRGVTPYRVAKETGISPSTLSQWKIGSYSPKIEKLQKIADYFDVPLEYFTGKVPKQPTPTTPYTRWVPILGRVVAGIPAEMVEDIIGYEEIPSAVGEAFALMIDGDSMAPMLLKGDVIVVRKQADVESGQIAIVAVNGDDATCKKLIKTEDGVILQPVNPDYDPIFYSNEDIISLPVTVLGQVIEIRRKL